MAIFNSYVSLPEGIFWDVQSEKPFSQGELTKKKPIRRPPISHDQPMADEESCSVVKAKFMRFSHGKSSFFGKADER
jgi:hypothetical protein